jgi:hypothetical protein
MNTLQAVGSILAKVGGKGNNDEMGEMSGRGMRNKAEKARGG